MPSNHYHFEDCWQVPFPPDAVWDVLSCPAEFPVWWKGVYLSTETVGPPGENHIGRRVVCVARGWLPYRLHFTIETTRLERPAFIEFKASGDFRTDASRWILTPSESGTEVILDWNPIVEKPIVKLLSPVLTPLFRWNHHWTMKRGQEQIVAYMKK